MADASPTCPRGHTLRRFVENRRGATAVEFALVAPLLCLVLGVAVEIGRMTMNYRQFETAVMGVSRHVARFPEYEIRAREYARPIAAALFPTMDVASLNLTVTSLRKDGGALTEEFPSHVLFGKDPEIGWRDYVKPVDYVEEESLIFVGASFEYRPFFPGISNFPLTFEKDVVILPSFNRKYPWNDGEVEDKYVY